MLDRGCTSCAYILGPSCMTNARGKKGLFPTWEKWMYILVIKPWKYWTSYNMILVVSAGRGVDGEGGRMLHCTDGGRKGSSPCTRITHFFGKKTFRVCSAGHAIFELMMGGGAWQIHGREERRGNETNRQSKEIKRPSQNHKQQQQRHLTRLKK